MGYNSIGTKVKVRLDYYLVTSGGGGYGLFSDCVLDIVNTVPEDGREIRAGTSMYNFTASIHGDYTVIKVRLIRGDAPSKGRLGTNKTAPIALAESEGMSEESVFVYDKNKGVLIAQYNYHGPKAIDLCRIVNAINKNERNEYCGIRFSCVPYITDSKIDLALDSDYITCIEAKTAKVSRDASDDEANFSEILKLFGLPASVRREITLKDRSGLPKGILQKLFLPNRSCIDNYKKLAIKMVDPASGKVSGYDLVSNKLKRNVYVNKIAGAKSLDIEDLEAKMIGNYESIIDDYVWSNSCVLK